MTNKNWRKVLAMNTEDAQVLAKIEPHKTLLDNLDDYSGRISVDGESYVAEVLTRLYLLANENVCSPAVIDFLVSLDDDDVRDGLVTDVFLEIALNQKRKVRFENELKRL